jgi:hypothetical protein
MQKGALSARTNLGTGDRAPFEVDIVTGVPPDRA